MAEHKHNMGTTYTYMCTCPHVQCGIQTHTHTHMYPHRQSGICIQVHISTYTENDIHSEVCTHTHKQTKTQAHGSTPIFLVVTSQFRVTPFIKFLESFEYLAS